MIFREQPESDACWRRTSPAAPLFPQKAGAVPSEGSSEHCVDAGCEPALVPPFSAHLRKKRTAFAQTLAHEPDQVISLSHLSMCGGSPGTGCGEWGEAGAAMVPLPAPSLVSWG